MSEESERFRARAQLCRELSAPARSMTYRDALEEMGRELDEEADNIEREKASQSSSHQIIRPQNGH